LGRAGVGAWLNSEIEQPDDSISEPPAALRDYLSDHREAIWNIVAALEKGFPDWGHRPNEVLWPTLTLLPTIMLERVLLVSALREAREGRPIDAERALEASWSLRAPVALPGNLLACLTAGHIGDWEGGVLRKMKASPVQWMTRMSGEKPWVELLDAFLEDTFADIARNYQLLAEHGTYFDPQAGLVIENYLANKELFLGTEGYTEEGFAAMERWLGKVRGVLIALTDFVPVAALTTCPHGGTSCRSGAQASARSAARS
jgi:hypothetical protein